MSRDATEAPPAGCRRAAAMCLTLAVSVSACRDSPTDPMATLVARETVPALDLGVALPSLPALAERAGTEGELAGAVADWGASWLGDTSVQAREAAVREAAPLLARSLGRAGVVQALDPVHRAARSLDGLDHVPEGLSRELLQARADALASREALDRDDLSLAVERGLMASDRLRAAGPGALARGLLARAERILAGTPEADRSSDAPGDGLDGIADVDRMPVTRDRARRLVTGARESLESGDALRALRQAYYACQILDGAAVR